MSKIIDTDKIVSFMRNEVGLNEYIFEQKHELPVGLITNLVLEDYNFNFLDLIKLARVMNIDVKDLILENKTYSYLKSLQNKKG